MGSCCQSSAYMALRASHVSEFVHVCGRKNYLFLPPNIIWQHITQSVLGCKDEASFKLTFRGSPKR